MPEGSEAPSLGPIHTGWHKVTEKVGPAVAKEAKYANLVDMVSSYTFCSSFCKLDPSGLTGCPSNHLISGWRLSIMIIMGGRNIG